MVKGGQEYSFWNQSLLGQWISTFAVGNEQPVVLPRVSLFLFTSLSQYFFPAGEWPAQRHIGLLGLAHRAQGRESHGVSPPEKRTCGLYWSLVAQTPLYFLINHFWHKTLKTIFVQKYENVPGELCANMCRSFYYLRFEYEWKTKDYQEMLLKLTMKKAKINRKTDYWGKIANSRKWIEFENI